MIYDQHILVTNEDNHPIVWDFRDNGQPFSVSGRTYTMVIRANENGTPTPAEDVTFVCTVDALQTHRVNCVGDCSTLAFGKGYHFQLTEDDVAIISGTVDVVAKL